MKNLIQQLITISLMLSCFTISLLGQNTYQDKKWITNGRMDAKRAAINSNQDIFFGGRMQREWSGDFAYTEEESFHISRTDLDGNNAKSNHYINSEYRAYFTSLEPISNSSTDLINVAHVKSHYNNAAYWAEGVLSRVNQDAEITWSKVIQHGSFFDPNHSRSFGSINYAGPGHNGRIIVIGTEDYEVTCEVDIDWGEAPAPTINTSGVFGPAVPGSFGTSINVQNNTVLNQEVEVEIYDFDCKEDKRYLSIFEIDANGTQIYKEALIDPNDTLSMEPIKILPIGEQDYIMLSRISGFHGQSINIDGFELTYLNANLDPVWSKRMLFEYYNHFPVDILVDQDKEYLYVLSVGTEDDTFSHMGKPEIFRFDLNGQNGIKAEYDITPYVSSPYQSPTGMAKFGNKLVVSGHLTHSTVQYSANEAAYLLHIDLSQGNALMADKVTKYGQGDGEWFYDVDFIGDHILAVGEYSTTYLYPSRKSHAYIVKAELDGYTECEYLTGEVQTGIITESLASRELEVIHADVGFSDFEFIRTEMELEEEGCDDEFFYIDLFQQDQEKPAAQVFPNPSQGLVQVQLGTNFDNRAPVKASIINMNGQIMRQFEMNQISNELKLNDLPSGIYILNLVQGQIKEQQKIVIQKD